ncbi:MAG: SIMPL domain-containing protein [Gammaproteobacteria bacterium]|nr:SIMPL domain-containing protein [Gammaproteobacteria bacterium]
MAKPMLTFVLLLLWTGLAAAESPLTYDRISLNVSAGSQVDNDTLVSVLYAQAEGNNPGRLADQINRTIGKAVAQAKAVPDVDVQTLDYSTNPVYRNQSLTGWRVRQSIQLQSRDSTALSELIAELQTSLAIGSISYTVSPQRMQQVEKELIDAAIAAFRERAQQVALAMGRNSYRLVQMNLNTPGNAPQPRMLRGMAMEMRADAAPPTLEAGSRRVEVGVHGTIELDAR